MRYVHERKGAAAAALLTVLFIAPVAIAQELPAPDAPWRAAENRDLIYLTQTLNHENFADKVLLLCATRTVHEDLESMCGDMRSSLEDSREQLQGWLIQWYGRGHSPELSVDQLAELASLEALADGEFEREFLRSVIRIHEDALKAMSPCRDGAEHEELMDYCDQQNDAWETRLALLQNWLCDWYGECGEGPVATDTTTWSALKAMYE